MLAVMFIGDLMFIGNLMLAVVVVGKFDAGCNVHR